MTIALYVIALAALIITLFKSKAKTMLALKKAGDKGTGLLTYIDIFLTFINYSLISSRNLVE